MAVKKVAESTKRALKKRQLMRYTGYPNRRNFALFTVHCIKAGQCKAERVRQIVDNWLKENIPANQQAEYLDIFKNLTENEIKYAGRFYPDDID